MIKTKMCIMLKAAWQPVRAQSKNERKKVLKMNRYRLYVCRPHDVYDDCRCPTYM